MRDEVRNIDCRMAQIYFDFFQCADICVLQLYSIFYFDLFFS